VYDDLLSFSTFKGIGVFYLALVPSAPVLEEWCKYGVLSAMSVFLLPIIL